MNTGHNWQTHPVIAKRYQMLAMAQIHGMDIEFWQKAIMSGLMDDYDLNLKEEV
jgi:hypothetical protein